MAFRRILCPIEVPRQVEPSDCPGVDSVVDRLQQIWPSVVDNLVLSQEEAQCFANRRRSLLRKYVVPVVPSVDPPAPVLIDGELEYVVEKILDSRFSRRKLQYLVKWKGYGQEDNSWVVASDVHADDLSHISESPAEIKEVLRLFPAYKNYTEVYNKNKLLTNKTVMAHGCYLTTEELIVFRESGAAISHCPNSNISLCSGHLDVRNALNHRVKIGLGTEIIDERILKNVNITFLLDVAGGYSISLLDAIRKAIETSKILFMERTKDEQDNNKIENEKKPSGINREAQNGSIITEYNAKVLSYKEAFRLATLGGSEALSIDHITGNFNVGKEFDALLINPEAKDSPLEVFSQMSREEMFQRFLYLGDDRNIKAPPVYVAGRCVVPFPNNA
ncbi:unnamed protein product [Ranitomeya imitator]|uniref:Chromo domain-containing protein n=1 Tax=Ranitomeya imitator TaxID=111125 RepID=A0ABN9L4I6_9NEOB|nr:unnamed protein product [Ranitomeya imitator]